MPTPAERQALLFIGAIALLGAGVRVVRATRGAPLSDAAVRAALAQQIALVDSAKAHDRARGRDPKASRKRSAKRDVVAPRMPSESVESFGYDSPSPLASRPAALDINRATAAELEALPGVGPALAKRIVADRDSCGPFGSLRELERVRGVGPALARRVGPGVTFYPSARLPGATFSACASAAHAAGAGRAPRRGRRQ